jgi:hypothetical protein
LKQTADIVSIDEGIQMHVSENAFGQKKTLGLRIEDGTAQPSIQTELLGKSAWFDCK